MTALIVGVIGGSFGAAIVNGIFKLIEQRRNRKAQKEDREDAKQDVNAEQSEDIRKLREDVNAQIIAQQSMMAALREVLGAQIKAQCLQYLDDGSILSGDYEDLKRMHKVYHDELNGNGFFDDLMYKVRKLPMKNPHSTVKE